MSSIFFHADGTPTRYPTSHADAKRLRKAKFDDGQTCSDCLSCTIKYTKTGQCIHCARLSAIAFYNTATAGHPFPEAYVITDDMREAGELMPDVPGVFAPRAPDEAIARGFSFWVRPEACSAAGHPGMRTTTGECWFCRRDKERKSPRKVALDAGERWYTPETPCRYCGQLAQRRVDNGQCAACSSHRQREDPSPRQKAIEAGERWYTPETPCKRCGTHAQRRVDNGQCAACQPPRGAQREQGSLAAQVMEQVPQLIMERSDAIKAGMPVYRTGRPCRRGHIAFRYTSTGACIDCMREDRGGTLSDS